MAVDQTPVDAEQRAEAEELTQGETESEADMIEQEESNSPYHSLSTEKPESKAVSSAPSSV